MRPATLLWRNSFLGTALWNLRMHSLSGHEMTTQDGTFLTQILPLSVFRLKILIYMYIYYKYIDNVYCCYIKRHYLKLNECAAGVWMGNVSVVFCIWVELVRRNLLFYVTLHWMLVCCGYEYVKFFLERKTGDHNFIEQYSRSWTHLRTLTEESEKRESEDEEVEEHLLYLKWMAGSRTVSLCDMMWSFVSTVWTDSSWCYTPKTSLRVSWRDYGCRLCTVASDNVKMTFFFVEGLHDDGKNWTKG